MTKTIGKTRQAVIAEQELRRAVSERWGISQQIKELEAVAKELAGVIEGALADMGVDKQDIQLADGTNVRAMMSVRENRKLSREKLLELGVKPSILEQATEVSTTQFVMVREVKAQ